MCCASRGFSCPLSLEKLTWKSDPSKTGSVRQFFGGEGRVRGRKPGLPGGNECDAKRLFFARSAHSVPAVVADRVPPHPTLSPKSLAANENADGSLFARAIRGRGDKKIPRIRGRFAQQTQIMFGNVFISPAWGVGPCVLRTNHEPQECVLYAFSVESGTNHQTGGLPRP